jgi:hypothetical protein
VTPGFRETALTQNATSSIPRGDLIDRTDIAGKPQQVAHQECTRCLRWQRRLPVGIAQIGSRVTGDETDEDLGNKSRAERAEAEAA